jgi:RNA polymerase sigma factor (sigma-70 family)
MPPDEFADIVREHEAMVFRVLRRMVGRGDLDDLAQDVFLRLYRALPHFEQRAQLSTYLYRITLNVARDEWRRRRAARRDESLTDPRTTWEERLSDQVERADEALARRQLWEIVQHCLPDLSEPERAALVLYHQEERSYDEIARIMQMPIGTVRTHLHRGRERLGRLVQERLR